MHVFVKSRIDAADVSEVIPHSDRSFTAADITALNLYTYETAVTTVVHSIIMSSTWLL